MLSDDLISAYLDGELDRDKRAMIEQYLASDKAAAARLQRLRAADEVLKQTFPATTSAKDNRLAAIVRANNNNTHGRRFRATRVAVLAAALAVGWLVGQVLPHPPQSFAISQQLAHLLDSQISGRVRDTEEGAFEVVLSLQSDAGEVCRQFRLTRDMQSTDVLACRSAEAWRMVAAATARQVEGYAPAGASSPLDAAIQNLGGVTALDQAEESALIERRWGHLSDRREAN